MRSIAATVLHTQRGEADRFLPEGPRAVTVEGRPALAWVNIQTAPDATGGDIHVRFWDGEHRTYAQSRRPGFLLPTDRADTLLVGREKEIGLLNLTTNHFTPLAAIEDASPRTIINDGEIVPGGRAIVFGTKDVRFAEPIAHLYLFTIAERRLTVLADGQTCSNGKVFACHADGLVLFDIDTPRKNVVRYRLDLESRRLLDGSPVLDLRDQEGFPDGMIDPDDGSVIIAFYNPADAPAGRAMRINLGSGQPIEEWTTPGSPRVTCPLIVEHDGRVRLVLTTAAEGMPADQRSRCPNAGNLFLAETSFAGAPATEIVRLGN
jgi:sugar lactone lactonase YvrE